MIVRQERDDNEICTVMRGLMGHLLFYEVVEFPV